MKKFGLCPLLGLFAFFLVTTAGPLKSCADTIVTIKLTGVGSNEAGGFYAYPYYFSVNGGPGNTALMCLGYYNGISMNESWTATIEPISAMSTIETTTGSPATAQLFPESVWEEAAWLYNDANVHPSNNDNDQLAAWGLFSSGVSGGNNAQLTAAVNFVDANPNSSLYSEFEIYVPTSGWPSGDDVPQVFIGYGSGPEPGSFILLFTGLLAFAGVLYRRQRAA